MKVDSQPGSARLVRVIAVVAMLVVAVLVWLAGNSSGNAVGFVADEDSAADVELELSASDVAPVQRTVLVRRLPLSGSLAPLVQSVIRSKVGGEILEVTVREGQAVKHGDVLVRIDTRNSEANLAAQRALLEKARADRSIAQLNFENSQRLLEKQFVAQNVVDTSRSVRDAAAASVKLAQAQLQLAEIALADAVVRAPFAGVVARRFAEPGEKITSDVPLFELVDVEHMELEAAAPAAEVAAIQVGQIARVRVDGYGERVFEARLERINPGAEQASRLIILYLAVDNADGALRGGMFAQGNLLIERSEPVLAIPASALINEAGLDYVMAIREGVVQRRAVRVGMFAANDNLVEIRDGVAEGEQVLAVQLASLEPGARVRVMPAAVN